MLEIKPTVKIVEKLEDNLMYYIPEIREFLMGYEIKKDLLFGREQAVSVVPITIDDQEGANNEL